MINEVNIKRTNSADPDFRLLIKHLDHELWNELMEDQATYDQYNKVKGLTTAVVLYVNEKPAGSGCFKVYNNETAEIKRMFVEKEYRGKGFASMILNELETWAIESGFQYAVLETSVHFEAAKRLYSGAGYKVIENYGQYAGLEESVCMKKQLDAPFSSSEFKNQQGIEYFLFEEDFVEKNIRCIPMIIRFKMDKAGIKLKLAEWNRFSVDERIELARKTCSTETDVKAYKLYLANLIKKYTGNNATALEIEASPAWLKSDEVPGMLLQKAGEFDWTITPEQWNRLTDLQRFALLKLSRPGHENKNFPKAMKEFGLIKA